VFFLAAGCCLLLLIASYANVFDNAFHFDDAHVLANNLYIRSLANAPRFFTDVRTTSALPQNQAYRPLVTLSLAVDYFLGHGLSARAFHLDQLFLLLVLGTALFLFYLRVMERASPGPLNPFLALFSATLFCVHTVNTETMNLMHARSEILSALGIVAGFLVYLGFPRLRRLHLYLLPVAAGVLAKTPAVLFAPLLFCWEFLRPAEDEGVRPLWASRFRRAFNASLPAFVVGALLFWFVERVMAPPTLNYGGGNRLAYAQTQAWVWLHYLRLFVLPAGLTADSDLQLIAGWYDTRVLVGLAVIAGLAFVAWRSARRRESWPVAFGLAWFAIGLAPTSSILPLAEPMNEHRVFLPFIGLTLAAVWGARLLLPRPFRRPAAAVSLCAVTLVALATGTFVRNRAWLTDETLWADVTMKSPANGRGWMNYGLALMARGQLVKARECFERASPLSPNYWALETNRGIVEDALGNPAAAEPHFKRAIELGPTQPDTHHYFARWLARVGRAPEADSHLETALRLSPGMALARNLLMDLRAAAGDSAGAAALARGTLEAEPQDTRARDYAEGRFPREAGSSSAANRQAGIAFGQSGDYVASAVAYRAALALDPSDADALNNLGWTLGKLGFFPEAVPPLERAIAMRPDFALARNNLAWIKSQIR